MMLLLLKFALVLIISFLVRCIERARDIAQLDKKKVFLHDILILYYVGYLHVALSMGALGLAWDRQKTGATVTQGIPLIVVVTIIFIFTLAGCISRGLVSAHEPECMSLHDKDWCAGVIVPNSLGLSALLLSLWSTC